MKKIGKFISLYSKELFISFLAIIGLVIFIPLFTASVFAKDLASREAIMNKNDIGVILLDRNNKPFFTFYTAKYRQFIPLSKIPKQMQEAVIASEDKNFYYHSGFSLPAIIRSFFIDLTSKDVVLGGSTITQQLVKNALLNSNKNYLRKIQEVVLAQEIEKRYSKQEILEMYLNSVYFGRGAFGIENAAETYFGKHSEDLTLSEDAFLTAILPSPSMASTNTDSKQIKEREQLVLQEMLEQKYISQMQAIQAVQKPLVFHSSTDTINSVAPHFALMVREQLIKQFGEEQIARSGFRVRTTLDLNWQKKAEEVVAQQVKTLHSDNVSNGSAVVMDPKTGDVKALVGSVDWFNDAFGKVNMATTPRSVGSSFKPIVYASALGNHLITPATILKDLPTMFPGEYHPLDYDRKFRGDVTVRRALSNSLNIPSVEVMQKVGVPKALTMAKQLGITTLKDPSQYGLSLVLGTGEVNLLELTNAYATFANNGTLAEHRIILSIQDKEGKNIYTSPMQTHQVLQPDVAFLISSILSDNKSRAEEFGNLLTISRTAAVKTGTAEDYKDSLTMGYTPSLAIGVWVGNNDDAPMDNVAGSLGAAPIWKNLMEDYLADTPVEAFLPPTDIVQAPVCRGSSTMEYFLPGTESSSYCQRILPSIPQAPRVFTSVPRYHLFPSGRGIADGIPANGDPEQLQQQIQQKVQKEIQEQLGQVQGVHIKKNE